MWLRIFWLVYSADDKVYFLASNQSTTLFQCSIRNLVCSLFFWRSLFELILLGWTMLSGILRISYRLIYCAYSTIWITGLNWIVKFNILKSDGKGRSHWPLKQGSWLIRCNIEARNWEQWTKFASWLPLVVVFLTIIKVYDLDLIPKPPPPRKKVLWILIGLYVLFHALFWLLSLFVVHYSPSHLVCTTF